MLVSLLEGGWWGGLLGSHVYRRAASQEVLEQVVCVGLTVSENLGREQMQQLCHTNSYGEDQGRRNWDVWTTCCLPTCTPTFPLGSTVIITFEKAFSHALWKASFLAVPSACTF